MAVDAGEVRAGDTLWVRGAPHAVASVAPSGPGARTALLASGRRALLLDGTPAVVSRAAPAAPPAWRAWADGTAHAVAARRRPGDRALCGRPAEPERFERPAVRRCAACAAAAGEGGGPAGED